MSAVDQAVQRVLGVVMRLRSGEAGQGLAEYGLILALVAVVVVAAVTLLGNNINSTLNSIAGSI